VSKEQQPLLEVANLVTGFRDSDGSITEAVSDISFAINSGETFALVGESGSGKSITSLSIMRLLPSNAIITQGQINFRGQDILQITEADMRQVRGQGIGMIFQEPMTSLNPVMTIGEQIAEAVRNANSALDKKAVYREVEELLDLVGINNYQERICEYPHQFSGGMRQRVMIAIALAGKPDLLIADEPTTALDVTIQAQVLKLIKDIQQKRQMAVMLITHDLGVVHDVADRIAVMRHGKILETADCKTFFTSPQHHYSQQLFEAIPCLSKRGQKLSVIDCKNEDINIQKDQKIEDHHTENTVLDIQQLHTYFPIKKGIFRRTVGHIKAVKDVSLTLKQGQTLALVGESGSGKTTLAKTVIRLLQASSGNITFEDIDITQNNITRRTLKNIRSDLQIVFQDPYSSMNPRMRVRDILEEGMVALDIEKDPLKREEKMKALLELVGLPTTSLNRYPHQFSGGQRQRIAIARALAVNPKLIICDEPTSALDVSVQAQILNLLKDLQNRLGLSYLFITHDISVVSYIADNVAVMYHGEIVEQGSVENIIVNPQHDYTKKLMSAVPTLYKESQ
jgi:peptide/nickel transport system ATP-binding protein